MQKLSIAIVTCLTLGLSIAGLDACGSSSAEKDVEYSPPDQAPSAKLTTRAKPPPAGPSSTAWAVTSAMRTAKRDEARNEALLAFDAAVSRYKTGQGPLEDAISWSTKAREMWAPNAAEDHRDRMRQLEGVVASRVQTGAAPTYELHQIGFHRALAESDAP